MGPIHSVSHLGAVHAGRYGQPASGTYPTWADRHVWKHYHPATSFADGKYLQTEYSLWNTAAFYAGFRPCSGTCLCRCSRGRTTFCALHLSCLGARTCISVTQQFTLYIYGTFFLKVTSILRSFWISKLHIYQQWLISTAGLGLRFGFQTIWLHSIMQNMLPLTQIQIRITFP